MITSHLTINISGQQLRQPLLSKLDIGHEPILNEVGRKTPDPLSDGPK